ncbi:MAG: glucokinase, partial [Chitinophagaceae bacterium]|nr:glucokinase [Chitinophagaceae bacterium]
MNVPLFLPRLTDSESDNIHLIAVDIGGTKTNFGLYKSSNQNLELLKEGAYPSQEYESFSDVVKKFISENQLAGIDRISIGVAGPVLDGKVHTTNLPWQIDKRILLQDTGVKEVSLINDLEATAYGLANIHEEYLAAIHLADNAKGNIAILAPGTGLGEAAMYWDGKAYRPFATEGGHSEFSPRNELDVELFYYLKNEFGIVSWEHLISGPGIHNIYKFLRDVKGEKEPVWLTERLAQEDPSMVISHTAIRELNAA